MRALATLPAYAPLAQYAPLERTINRIACRRVRARFEPQCVGVGQFDAATGRSHPAPASGPRMLLHYRIAVIAQRAHTARLGGAGHPFQAGRLANRKDGHDRWPRKRRRHKSLQTAAMVARRPRTRHRTCSKSWPQFDSRAVLVPSHPQYAAAYDRLQRDSPHAQLAHIMVDCAAQSLAPS